mmetsp:Transcript_25766/g.76151  ORF Transcript_25766/g.76151 Transcript_25766/m.76151 type:complete len:226 (-) Transcript_25766:244-921(-)
MRSSPLSRLTSTQTFPSQWGSATRLLLLPSVQPRVSREVRSRNLPLRAQSSSSRAHTTTTARTAAASTMVDRMSMLSTRDGCGRIRRCCRRLLHHLHLLPRRRPRRRHRRSAFVTTVTTTLRGGTRLGMPRGRESGRPLRLTRSGAAPPGRAAAATRRSTAGQPAAARATAAGTRGWGSAPTDTADRRLRWASPAMRPRTPPPVSSGGWTTSSLQLPSASAQSSD